VYGFDVYEVRQGERTPDDPTSTYGVGGDENAHIGVLQRTWACQQKLTN
jgi:hypothetical protein